MEANELEHEEGASQYALGVTLTPNTKHDLLPEFRSMKKAITEWVKKRGDSGVLIVVNIVSSPDVHDVFEDLLAKTYAQGNRFARMLQKRLLQITLLDMEGNECGQYEVEPSDSASDAGG